MKVQEIIDRVRNAAGDLDSIQFTDAVIVNWINDAMKECVIDNMLLQKTASQSTVIGTGSYAVPTDVLKMYSVKYNSQKLTNQTLEEFDEMFYTDGTDRGTPVVYTIWAGNIKLFPLPDAVKTLELNYSYNFTEASTGALNTELPLPNLYHRRVVDYCLAMVAEADDDMNRYQIKMQEFKTGVQNLKDHAESTHDLYPSISVNSRDQGEDGGWWE